MSQDPFEPITNAPETLTGWTHLSQTAFPLLGRIGTIVGGIFSLLAVFKAVSGEIVTTIEGFVLVAALIASGVVVFYRSTVVVNEIKKTVYLYPNKARVIAAIVMSISAVLFVFFVLRLFIPSIPGSAVANVQPPGRPQTPPPGQTRGPDRGGNTPRVGGPISTTIPTSTFTPIPSATTTRTPAPSATATATPSPVPSATATATASSTNTPAPSRTPTQTALDQINDVNVLLKLGNDAIDAKKYSQAQAIFMRATFIEATNAQAQLGLGQSYFYQSNFNQASESLQIALRLNANLHDAHAYLGWIYDYRQDRAKAIAEYDVFLKAAPRDDPLRQDILDRERLLSSSTPAPSLTPIGGTPFSNPSPARAIQTATPTLTATPNK